jgi:hypothetical protein
MEHVFTEPRVAEVALVTSGGMMDARTRDEGTTSSHF